MPVEAAAPSLRRPAILPLHEAPKDSPAKMRKAATEFEALLINQLLSSARETESSSTNDGGDTGQANSTLVELGEQQFAQALASSGGLGIAKMVVAGLTKHADR